MESIQGTIERITYHNPEQGFCVLKVKIKGARDLTTVVGRLIQVHAGEVLEAQGDWINNKTYGLQFQAKTIKTLKPATLEGVEKYLGSGLIKGIGKAFSKRLIDHFGADIFTVIEKEPERLKEVPGLGQSRVEAIIQAWSAQRSIQDIMIFLQSNGVSPARAARIYKIYGDQAIEFVKSNPYRLAEDIHGIGFKTADQIAQKLGIDPESIDRARAALQYGLKELASDGHCLYPREDLLEKTQELLQLKDPNLLTDALTQELLKGSLLQVEHPKGTCIALPYYFRTESELSERLFNLLKHPIPWRTFDRAKAIDWASQQLKIDLAPEQRAALEMAFSQKVSIITGGPGTGKTTITQVIITILSALHVRIALCSPTGRAAKRLSECTKREAKTIHRILGFKGGTAQKGGERLQFHTDNPLPYDLILVDEASMVDAPLALDLVRAVAAGAALIWVGDQDQLPSVGPGQVLRDLIESGTLPCTRLKHVYRQAAQSEIIQAAHRVNSGEFPRIPDLNEGSDFFFIEEEDPERAANAIVKLVSEEIPKRFKISPISQVQVLTPMQKGTLGTRNLNQVLQKTLNPNPRFSIERFGFQFSVRDKVLVLANDYDKDIFNGDIATIESMDSEEEICVLNLEGRRVELEFSDLDLIAPAYAMTIHKSQGSEFQAVVIPVATQHFMMLKRNLLYTAITRGKKWVFLVGTKKALAIAVKNQDSLIRVTMLKELCRKNAHIPV